MRKFSSFDLSFSNIALSLAFVLLFAIIINAAEGPQPLATVTKVKGSPSVSRAGTSSAAIRSGDYIYMGDTLKTDKDSKITLLFEDGEIRVITSDSNVSFAKSQDYSNISSVAKVAVTVADAINSKSLEATFHEAVTGVKLSVGSKEKKEAPAATASGSVQREEKLMEAEHVSKKSEYAASDASETVSGSSPSSQAMPAPAPPVMPSAAAPASKPALSEGSQGAVPTPSAPAEIAADVSGDSGQSKIEAENRLSAAGGGSSNTAAKSDENAKLSVKSKSLDINIMQSAPPSKSVSTKNWGRWLEGETMVSWKSLLPESVTKTRIAKIIVQSSSAPQNVTDVSDTIKLSGALEEKIYFTVAVYGPANNNLLASFRAYFNNDAKANEFIRSEIAKFAILKKEDMDTYLYAKAMTLKKYSYYIAALSALNEIEKNNPGIVMAHIVRLKTSIYLGMGEQELARSEALKIKK